MPYWVVTWEMLFERHKKTFERLSSERCYLKHTSKFLWEIVVWEMLFERYKNMPLRDCLLRAVVRDIQKYSFERLSVRDCSFCENVSALLKGINMIFEVYQRCYLEIFLWDIPYWVFTWEMLFERYKKHLRDCVLRDVIWDIQAYSVERLFSERCWLRDMLLTNQCKFDWELVGISTELEH